MRSVHHGGVFTLCFFAGEPLLFTSGGDNAIKVWIFDQSDGSARLLRSRAGHSAPPQKIRFYSTSSLILSAARDKSFRLFSTVRVRHPASFCSFFSFHKRRLITNTHLFCHRMWIMARGEDFFFFVSPYSNPFLPCRYCSHFSPSLCRINGRENSRKVNLPPRRRNFTTPVSRTSNCPPLPPLMPAKCASVTGIILSPATPDQITLTVGERKISSSENTRCAPRTPRVPSLSPLFA
jgi:WD40 repeat protein